MKKRKKKNKNSIPRHKRMKRKGRLIAAKKWIEEYTGKNIVKGYSKHFAVDKLCAIKELELLGIEIDEEYKKKLEQSFIANQERKRREAEKKEQEEDVFDLYSDDRFYFIAGYTPGGAPYGITWEEIAVDEEERDYIEMDEEMWDLI